MSRAMRSRVSAASPIRVERARDRRRDVPELAVQSRTAYFARRTEIAANERTIEQAKASEPHWQREPIIIAGGLRIGRGASWLRGYEPARQSPTYSQCSAARSYN